MRSRLTGIPTATFRFREPPRPVFLICVPRPAPLYRAGIGHAATHSISIRVTPSRLKGDLQVRFRCTCAVGGASRGDFSPLQHLHACRMTDSHARTPPPRRRCASLREWATSATTLPLRPPPRQRLRSSRWRSPCTGEPRGRTAATYWSTSGASRRAAPRGGAILREAHSKELVVRWSPPSPTAPVAFPRI
jgi:hypothetical protein